MNWKNIKGKLTKNAKDEVKSEEIEIVTETITIDHKSDSEKESDAIRKLLAYSFDAVGWDYSKLTKTERELVSESEFEVLRAKYQKTKHVGDIETDEFSLEVYECVCGFHIGLDATYLDQVDESIILSCPSCQRKIKTKQFDVDKTEQVEYETAKKSNPAPFENLGSGRIAG